jgi:hypothetical protein
MIFSTRKSAPRNVKHTAGRFDSLQLDDFWGFNGQVESCPGGETQAQRMESRDRVTGRPGLGVSGEGLLANSGKADDLWAEAGTMANGDGAANSASNAGTKGNGKGAAS